MTNSSSGNYLAQSAVARESGTGGPGQQPGNSDKRVAIIGTVVLILGVVALFVFG
ncbi:MAG TPA: hypothetical protein VK860_06800 [Ilumatobacteraceae bacterium]|jgi:hypothetical protein|nr:hypothetical protein [Ilumatobacteraceae bacterium]